MYEPRCAERTCCKAGAAGDGLESASVDHPQAAQAGDGLSDGPADCGGLAPAGHEPSPEVGDGEGLIEGEGASELAEDTSDEGNRGHEGAGVHEPAVGKVFGWSIAQRIIATAGCGGLIQVRETIFFTRVLASASVVCSRRAMVSCADRCSVVRSSEAIR